MPSSSSAPPPPSTASSSPSAFFDISKDPAIKRKRVNRSAKLKQSKLEARREQWLSHHVSSISKDFSRNGEQGDGNVNNLKDENFPSHHDSVSSLTHNKECLQHAEGDNGTEIDPGQTRLPSHQGIKHDKECLQHPEHDSTENNPGEVIDSQYLEPSTISYLCHMHSGDSGRGPGLVDIDPKSCSLLRIKVSQKKGGAMRRRNVPCTSNGRKSPFSDWGKVEEEEASPESCGDLSPKSKVTKVGGGSQAGKTALSEKKTRNGKFLETGLLNGASDRKDTVNGWARDYSGYSDPDDGWEEVADALELPCDSEKINKSSIEELQNVDEHNSCNTIGKPTEKIQIASGRAWKQDDVFRPPCLPSLKRQQSLSPCVHKVNLWSPSDKKSQIEISDPSPCPICTEELDSTDSSFDPCPCGFRLCLFCYHRIASDDGRCPGCRETYNRELSSKSSYVH